MMLSKRKGRLANGYCNEIQQKGNTVTIRSVCGKSFSPKTLHLFAKKPDIDSLRRKKVGKRYYYYKIKVHKEQGMGGPESSIQIYTRVGGHWVAYYGHAFVEYGHTWGFILSLERYRK
jgi:hypothetical protein